MLNIEKSKSRSSSSVSDLVLKLELVLISDGTSNSASGLDFGSEKSNVRTAQTRGDSVGRFEICWVQITSEGQVRWSGASGKAVAAMQVRYEDKERSAESKAMRSRSATSEGEVARQRGTQTLMKEREKERRAVQKGSRMRSGERAEARRWAADPQMKKSNRTSSGRRYRSVANWTFIRAHACRGHGINMYAR